MNDDEEKEEDEDGEEVCIDDKGCNEVDDEKDEAWLTLRSNESRVKVSLGGNGGNKRGY